MDVDQIQHIMELFITRAALTTTGASNGMKPVMLPISKNVNACVGCVLTLDGCRYLLPIELLQTMNEYRLSVNPRKSCPTLYAPFKFAQRCGEIKSEDDPEYSSLVEKLVDFDTVRVGEEEEQSVGAVPSGDTSSSS